jgi:hypothetical protein
MNEDVSKAASEFELKRGTSLLIILIGIVSLSADWQSPSPDKSTTSASESSLPRNAVIQLTVANRFFPEVTQEGSTGQNLTAVGNPKATRSVIYVNSDDSKKVTITVDQYVSSVEASSAYQEAVHKSKIVPGFKPVPAENLGQNAFIGTVTQAGETHIGLGALHGRLIVGVTLAGYDPTPETTAKLVSVTSEQERAAKAALGAIPKK